MKPRTVLPLALPLVMAAATGTALASALASAPKSGPAPKQIRAATRRATHSRGLWATVNICRVSDGRDTVGVRAQMPALGFAATLEMQVGLDYYSPQSSPAFLPLPGTRTVLKLGTGTTGYHQDGVSYTVKPPAILRGTVRFVWRIGPRVLASAVRTTSSGHRGAQQGDPKGFSAATCRFGE